jgi:hypothetical protein
VELIEVVCGIATFEDVSWAKTGVETRKLRSKALSMFFPFVQLHDGNKILHEARKSAISAKEKESQEFHLMFRAYKQRR